MMRLPRFAIYGLAVLLAAACAGPSGIGPAPSPACPAPSPLTAWASSDGQGAAYLLQIAGGPSELGFAHGCALADEIRAGVAVAVHQCAQGWPAQTRACRKRAALRRALPAELLAELQGIARGAGVAESDLLLMNLDMPAEAGHTESAGFAAWGQATLAGETMLGAVAPGDGRVWIVRTPAGGRRTAVLSLPGRLGGMAGMNADGLAAGVLAVDSVDTSADGLPSGVMLRLTLEQALTAEDALGVAMALPHAGGAQLLFVDPKGARGLEYSARVQRELPARLDTLALAGLFLDPDLSATEVAALSADELADHAMMADRLERLVRANVGWIGRDKALALLARLGAGSPVTAVLLAPESLRVWAGDSAGFLQLEPLAP